MNPTTLRDKPSSNGEKLGSYNPMDRKYVLWNPKIKILWDIIYDKKCPSSISHKILQTLQTPVQYYEILCWHALVHYRFLFWDGKLYKSLLFSTIILYSTLLIKTQQQPRMKRFSFYFPKSDFFTFCKWRMKLDWYINQTQYAIASWLCNMF